MPYKRILTKESVPTVDKEVEVKIRSVFVALVAVSALVLTGCASTPEVTPDSGSGTPIKVGVIVPLSGTYASEGQEVRRGYELALAEKDGMVGDNPIELVFGDAFTPEDTIAEVDRLATLEDVDIFVGTYATPASLAGSETAARHGLAWIETHAITDSLTTRGLETYVRVGPRAADFAEASAEFVIEGLADHISDKSVYVDTEDGPYGTSVAETQVAALEKAGFQVTSAAHKAAATDVTDSVLAAKGNNPNVWLLTGYVPDLSLLLRTAAAQDFRPEAIVLTGAGDAAAVFEAVGAEDLTGTFVVAYTSPIVNPEWAPGNASFYSTYREKFGSEPLGTVANTGFTGMTSVLTILEEADGATDTAAISAAAAAVDIPEGGLPNGWGLKIDKDQQNQGIRLLAVQWREDGTVPAVWPEEAAGDGETLQFNK